MDVSFLCRAQVLRHLLEGKPIKIGDDLYIQYIEARDEFIVFKGGHYSDLEGWISRHEIFSSETLSKIIEFLMNYEEEAKEPVYEEYVEEEEEEPEIPIDDVLDF